MDEAVPSTGGRRREAPTPSGSRTGRRTGRRDGLPAEGSPPSHHEAAHSQRSAECTGTANSADPAATTSRQ